MRAPVLYSCWFEVPEGKAWPWQWYERHARVLEHSARVNSPGWDVVVRRIGPSTVRPAALGGGNTSSYAYNTHKLEEWRRIVHAAQDGDRLLLIDADTMILSPLDPVWQLDFDVAYTTKREHTRLPLNAGVIFLRITPKSRAFIDAWWRWNLKLLGDAGLHAHYRRTYAGMNQAALGALLENGGPKIAQLFELPCTEWNCESATWRLFDPARPPRIVHVKGAMRRGLMGEDSRHLATEARGKLAAIWWGFERDALKAKGA